MAENPPNRTALPWTRPSALYGRANEIGLGGSLGVEPGALHALGSTAIIAGDGGDQCRHSVDAVISTIDEIGMKPQGRKAAMADGAGVQVGFRMDAIDGPATPPEAARRFLTVIAAGVIAASGGDVRR